MQVRVSRVCLGTMTFGARRTRRWRLIMDRYVELGGNFFDTADAYSAGASEEIVGRWLKQRGARRDIVLGTKSVQHGPGPNDGGLSRLHIQQGVEDSLSRLQTEVIDLYQIHRWDPGVPVEETIRALDDLVRAGKVRYIGCSNLTAWQLSKFLHLAESAGLTRFISLQPIYNALNRGIEREILPLCADAGLGVIPYNPLAGGMLTGKYVRGEQRPSGARLGAFSAYYDRYTTSFDVVGLVAQAQERGVTPCATGARLGLGNAHHLGDHGRPASATERHHPRGGDAPHAREQAEYQPSRPALCRAGPVYDRTD